MRKKIKGENDEGIGILGPPDARRWSDAVSRRPQSVHSVNDFDGDLENRGFLDRFSVRSYKIIVHDDLGPF